MPKKLLLGAGPHFDGQLKILQRRIDRILALKRGELEVKRIDVEGGYVKRHYRSDHTRLIITRKK